MDEMLRELFECLMNRIYNSNDFERAGPMSVRERNIIDKYLEQTADEEGEEVEHN